MGDIVFWIEILCCHSNVIAVVITEEEFGPQTIVYGLFGYGIPIVEGEERKIARKPIHIFSLLVWICIYIYTRGWQKKIDMIITWSDRETKRGRIIIDRREQRRNLEYTRYIIVTWLLISPQNECLRDSRSSLICSSSSSLVLLLSSFSSSPSSSSSTRAFSWPISMRVEEEEEEGSYKKRFGSLYREDTVCK